MNRAWIVLMVLFAFGCPPPSYVDIYNNTGNTLQINAPDRTYTLAQGQSLKLEWRDLFKRWQDLHSNGSLWPILQLEVLGRIVEYQYSPIQASQFVHRYGNVVTTFVQVEPGFELLVAEPNVERPVAPGHVQPTGWPLMPL